ncbi:hypothetical protein COV20_05180 [Candidatus Woesearchaeota archaeon CG10_big_fil_rev_8_21_14_0_10_45_16]|nr:MAG: hypothetical protein COV20_05180 [Candidatus Woesearchaeota archaeon CG10_big_fil_rev_8_21_14_0_10_45_16]
MIHCWDGQPDYCWYPWLKRQLEANDFSVKVPAMPETEAPKQDLWVPKLRQVVGQSDEPLILIGHSIGCITILRYLETLPEDQNITGVILVAGFSDNLGFEELKNYFQTPLDWEKIRSRCSRFIAIHSDNDPFVPLTHAEIFKKNLSAETVILHDRKHFSGPVDDEQSCLELPEVLQAVLRISGKR